MRRELRKILCSGCLHSRCFTATNLARNFLHRLNELENVNIGKVKNTIDTHVRCITRQKVKRETEREEGREEEIDK